ncbi:hypothetical protein BEH94_00100 [Candidatus Altiarchaeales archaeon WOR_SM1_SCG]|nr:hypothetical protein BEH94_00100 [Candidatus Altiarchaeales archaeon WOR_SM1_SCG]
MINIGLKTVLIFLLMIIIKKSPKYQNHRMNKNYLILLALPFIFVISAILSYFNLGLKLILLPLLYIFISGSYVLYKTQGSRKLRVLKVILFATIYISLFVMLFWIIGFVKFDYMKNDFAFTSNIFSILGYFSSLLSYFSSVFYSLPYIIRVLILVVIFLMIIKYFEKIFMKTYRTISIYVFSPYFRNKMFKFIIMYLFVIFLFGVLYYITYNINPTSFSSSSELSFYDFFYFSVVTITTLGYGDISPESGLTQTLVIIEVLTNIFFLLVYFQYIISDPKIKKEFNQIEIQDCPKLFHKLYAYMDSDLVNRICNFIFTYSFIILVFGTSFHILCVFDYDSFDPMNKNEELDYLDFVYFSVVTITTLGYGDISPESLIGKFLVSVEVLVSILILLVYLSYVMSKYNK